LSGRQGAIVFEAANGAVPGTIGTHSWQNITKDSCRVAASGYTAAFVAGNASVLGVAAGATVTVKLDAEL
jgi:hypothetical protein